MEKVLVTGGSGFIGNHLVHRLLSLKKKVIVLDKCVYKSTYHTMEGATLVEGDVLSLKLMEQYLDEVDTCFHLAAFSSVPVCDKDWIFAHENNVLAFNGLLDTLVKLSHPLKLVYASSSAVYGNNKNLPLSESDLTLPSSIYGVSKLSNELYARARWISCNQASIGLRLFNVYGPGQSATSSYSGVMSQFKHKIETQHPLVIFGDGSQTRDFIYIDDVVEALLAAASTPENKMGVFNVCSGKNISIQELAETMLSLANAEIPIIHEGARTGDIHQSRGDINLAKKELNFVAKTDILEGLRIFLQS